MPVVGVTEIDAEGRRPMSAGCSTSSTRRKRPSRRRPLERHLLRPCDPVGRRHAAPRRRQLRHRRGRVRRRARPQRLGQDDADAGDPRPPSGRIPGASRSSAHPRPRHAGRSATCRRPAPRRPTVAPFRPGLPRRIGAVASVGDCRCRRPPRHGARSTGRSRSSTVRRSRERPLSRMSGGERQRLLIAEALSAARACSSSTSP